MCSGITTYPQHHQPVTPANRLLHNIRGSDDAETRAEPARNKLYKVDRMS